MAEQAKSDEKPSGRSRLRDISGFWATLGAILGALIGGIFSFQAAAMSTSAEAARSRTAFFLTERVAVYSSLLGKAQAFQLSATRYNNLMQLSGNDGEAEVALKEALADYEDAVAASWQVEVVATPPVQKAKQPIAEDLDKARNLLADKTAEAANYFHELDRVVTGHTTQFADAAAKELDTER